jgi:flagellar motility protein MotE (MotC chaperone)
MFSLRLLPVVIFVGALLLTIKLGGLWEGVTGIKADLTVSKSQAQQAAPSTPPKPSGQQVAAKTPAPAQSPSSPFSGPAQAQTPPAAPAPAQNQQQAAKTPPNPPIIAGSDEAPQFTQTELDVLQKLAARRDEISSREREMEVREGLVKAAEQRIEKKIVELKGMQQTIEGLLRKYDEQEDSKMKSLVKIYENMKPKDAGKIFDELDMPVLLDVIERMSERKAAAIIAEVNPLKAKVITSELAHRRQLPKPSGG